MLDDSNGYYDAWPPQDGQLALVAQGEEAVGKALWLVSDTAADKAVVRLLVDPGHADSSVDSHQWSIDGAHVSFQLRHMGDMAKREIHYYVDGELQIDTVSRAFPGESNLRFDVGVVEVASGKSRLLERQDNTFPIWNYGLSSDGRKLFVEFL